ncbi:MAG: hypothetical protein COA74_02915 [Gammaproteobacteria bacterium]|nr:MAG: hypothetical protein COA74_02915 [Gammaproteobacteria bacterium]
MNQCILGIDAGATKTLGLLKCLNTGQSWSAVSGPGSLSSDISTTCQNIGKVAKELLSLGNCSAAETLLVCGAAGTTNIESKNSLKKALQEMHFVKPIITTDAQTSLYGAGNGAPIIVIALGTGSVAMRLDTSGCEKQFGGWGLAVGDQASGAYIGRAAITSILLEYDKDDFVADRFMTEMFTIIGDNKQKISSWLTNATTTKFAELAPIVFSSTSRSKIARDIMKKAVTDVESLIVSAQGDNRLPVCLIGGLAQTIYPLLSADLRSRIIPAKGNAVNGAIYLGEQFLNLNNKTNRLL